MDKKTIILTTLSTVAGCTVGYLGYQAWKNRKAKAALKALVTEPTAVTEVIVPETPDVKETANQSFFLGSLYKIAQELGSDDAEKQKLYQHVIKIAEHYRLNPTDGVEVLFEAMERHMTEVSELIKSSLADTMSKFDAPPACDSFEQIMRGDDGEVICVFHQDRESVKEVETKFWTTYAYLQALMVSIKKDFKLEHLTEYSEGLARMISDVQIEQRLIYPDYPYLLGARVSTGRGWDNYLQSLISTASARLAA